MTAARDAGIEKLTLVEEPAAAFYSWIANDLARSQKSLFDGQIVLVCDVGGGTSDFTLIRVSREGDKIDFTRTAVGKHLSAGRRQSRPDAGLAGGGEARQDALRPPADRFAPPVRRGQGTSALGAGSEEGRHHRAGRRVVAGQRNAEDGDPARRSSGARTGRISSRLRTVRPAQGRRQERVPRTGPALRLRSRP